MKYMILVCCFFTTFLQSGKTVEEFKREKQIHQELLNLKNNATPPKDTFIIDSSIDYACIAIQKIGEAYDDKNYSIPQNGNTITLEDTTLIDKKSRKLLPEVREFLKEYQLITRKHGKYVLNLE